MKRAIAALAVCTAALWATNGDELIGVGPKSRAMGGVGIALDLGAENGLNNPAFIGTGGKTEFILGGTLFLPDVSYDGGKGYRQSDADTSVVPVAAVAGSINDRLEYGVGMFGTAGMGVDYRDEDESTLRMVTALQIMKFAVPLSYRFGALRVGYTPYIQYSSLDMQYTEPTPLGRRRGAGVAQDLNLGHVFGVGYDFAGRSVGGVALGGLKVGMVYKSSVEMDVKDQLKVATELFEMLGYIEDLGDTLEQPAQFGLGLSYRWRGRHLFAFDYRRVYWGSAAGYETLGWEDQDVFALGYAYETEKWTVRAGYNYARKPFSQQNGSTAQGATVNLFNLLGFPATVERHFTFGGEYRVDAHLTLAGAFVYAPETTTTYDTSGITPSVPFLPDIIADSASVKHSQSSFTFTLGYRY